MSEMSKTMVSACLAGFPCRYDGKSQLLPEIVELVRRGEALPLCPEQLAGLPVPRKPVEKVGDKSLAADGEDFTDIFDKAAQETLNLCQAFGCGKEILKSKSPSCGFGIIYDGSFSGRLVSGNGVTADLLQKNGIEIMTDEEFVESINTVNMKEK